MNDEQIDAMLDDILKAAGSALRYYTLPKSREDMRAAVRKHLPPPVFDARIGVPVKDLQGLSP